MAIWSVQIISRLSQVRAFGSQKLSNDQELTIDGTILANGYEVAASDCVQRAKQVAL